MLFLLVNETRTGLSPDDYAELGQKMKTFYSNIPEGIKIISEYSTIEKNKNFSIIETEYSEKINELKTPFEKYVKIEVYQVEPTNYRG